MVSRAGRTRIQASCFQFWYSTSALASWGEHALSTPSRRLDWIRIVLRLMQLTVATVLISQSWSQCEIHNHTEVYQQLDPAIRFFLAFRQHWVCPHPDRKGRTSAGVLFQMARSTLHGYLHCPMKNGRGIRRHSKFMVGVASFHSFGRLPTSCSWPFLPGIPRNLWITLLDMENAICFCNIGILYRIKLVH